MKSNYIDFPKSEYKNYKERLKLNKIIYTTRVSNEMNKYKLNTIYDSPFGKLKVIYSEHLNDIEQHPFFNELSENQLKEINQYIKHGYDLIGLVKIK